MKDSAMGLVSTDDGNEKMSEFRAALKAANEGYGARAVRVGFGTRVPAENVQLIDSKKRQKRSDRYFRRFEVHGGYTDSEFPKTRRPSSVERDSFRQCELGCN